jgi:hypothetical protein
MMSLIMIMQLLVTLVTPNRKPNNVIIWSCLPFPDCDVTSYANWSRASTASNDTKPATSPTKNLHYCPLPTMAGVENQNNA